MTLKKAICLPTLSPQASELSLGALVAIGRSPFVSSLDLGTSSSKGR